MPRNQNPATVLARLRSAKEGLTKRLPKGIQSMTMRGATQSVEAIVKRIDECIAIYEAPEDLEIARATAIMKRRSSQRNTLEFLEDVRSGVTPIFGSSSVELTNFGFRPRRRPKKLTSKQKVTKADKAKKTRELLHTMGKKQKKDLKAGKAQPPSPKGDVK